MSLHDADLLCQQYIEDGLIWKGGIPPLDFPTFAELLDGSPLYPYQEAKLTEAGWIYPNEVFSPLRQHQELELIWGKGSGKDFVIAKFKAWVAYLVCHLAIDPAVFFGLSHGTRLDVINVAPNEKLALNVFFDYLKKFIKHPIFDPFNPKILSSTIGFYSPGIDWRLPDVTPYMMLYSLNSKSSGLDGYNLLCWTMDEADDFLDTEKRSNAADIHKIFRSSGSTRMNTRWFGMVISYPRTADGFVMTLKSRAEGTNSEPGDTSIFVDLASTFTVRPDRSREDPSIAEDYRYNPREAMALYDCIAMPTEDAFFEFPERILECVNLERMPCATVDIIDDWRDESGKIYITGAVNGINKKPGAVYFLGGDGGTSGDSFAISVWHIDETGSAFDWICPRCGEDELIRSTALYTLIANVLDAGDRWNLVGVNELVTPYSKSGKIACGCCQVTPIEFHPSWGAKNWWKRGVAEPRAITIGGRSIQLPTISEDLLLEFQPHRADRPGDINKPVYHPGVQKICEELIIGLGIKRAGFDSYTTQLTQYLNGIAGCSAETMSMANPEQFKRARCYKAMAYSGAMTLMPNEKRDREVTQLQRKNNRIDHPVGGSKDLYDAESIAVYLGVTYENSALEIAFAGD